MWRIFAIHHVSARRLLCPRMADCWLTSRFNMPFTMAGKKEASGRQWFLSAGMLPRLVDLFWSLIDLKDYCTHTMLVWMNEHVEDEEFDFLISSQISRQNDVRIAVEVLIDYRLPDMISTQPAVNGANSSVSALHLTSNTHIAGSPFHSITSELR